MKRAIVIRGKLTGHRGIIQFISTDTVLFINKRYKAYLLLDDVEIIL